MCLNSHLSDNSVQCLGMMRIAGSMKAEDSLKLIEIKLEDFELNLNNHMFGMVTDGASELDGIKTSIQKIRMIVRFFKRSPLRNDDLQRCCLAVSMNLLPQ